jgi:hypothetical protein
MADPGSLEVELNAWMDEHEAEILDLLEEELDRFRDMHPGVDEKVGEQNALLMANRRFLARAIGAVLPAWIDVGTERNRR